MLYIYHWILLVALTIVGRITVLVKSQSSASICTEPDDVNGWDTVRFITLFTVYDKIYLRYGSSEDITKYWVYDIKLQQISDNSIAAGDLFPGCFKLIRYASAIVCDECPDAVKNLVIIIGRDSFQSYYGFQTFRHVSGDQFVKIRDGSELPKDWQLGDGEGVFKMNGQFPKFFPEELVNEKINHSIINAFTFYPKHRLVIMKYFTDDKGERHLVHRKVNTDGSISPFTDTMIRGTPRILNMMFNIGSYLYTIDNDPQYMPLISHRIKVVEDPNGQYVFEIEDLNIDARDFFHCSPLQYGETWPTIETEETIITTTPTTVSTTVATTAETTVETTTTETETSTESTVATDSTPEKTIDTTISTTMITTEQPVKPTNDTHPETPPESNDGPDNKEDGLPDNVFWLILILIVVIILIVVLCAAFMWIYLRNKSKGTEQQINSRGISIKRQQSLSTHRGSPSNASLRSHHNARQSGLAEPMTIGGRSPSTASLRTTGHKGTPREPLTIGVGHSPSMASMRTTKK